MGYNYAEAFNLSEELPEQGEQSFEESLSGEELEEYTLHRIRLDQIRIKLQEILKDVDSEVAQIVKNKYKLSVHDSKQRSN